MIDFGLSKRYKCPKSGKHKEPKKVNGIMGTPRYCSLNAYIGYEQSRRDDLESIGNLLVYFSNEGWLPWIACEEPVEFDEDIIDQKELRKNCTPEIICEGLPDCFLKYWKYVRGLQFYEDPNYAYLIGLFNKEFEKHEYDHDFTPDWVLHRQEVID
jgi:serine/threonine protein kinase